MSDDYTLQYPREIAPQIGISVNRINAFKTRGCRFYGRKTCVAWVREHLNQVTGFEPEQREHPPRLAENKFDAQAANYG